MTIYAIVNNLIKESSCNGNNTPVCTIISQAGILQGGNPYFVPEFAKRFEARLGLAVKIGKLGKGISARFAYRYVDSAAPCILFVATDLLQSLQDQGLPWTSAISYDRCLAIGKFSPISMNECEHCDITLTLESADGSIEQEWRSPSLKTQIEETLTVISRDNTLKMGDLLLMGISGEGPQLFPDMRAHLRICEKESLDFNIR